MLHLSCLQAKRGAGEQRGAVFLIKIMLSFNHPWIHIRPIAACEGEEESQASLSFRRASSAAAIVFLMLAARFRSMWIVWGQGLSSPDVPA